MKKLISTLTMLLVVVAGVLVAPQVASASASQVSKNAVSSTEAFSSAEAKSVAAVVTPMATGGYEYICLGIDGSSWSLRSGQNLTDCKGSKLLKYINGSHVATYNLAYGGQVVTSPSSGGCVLAFAGAVSMVLFPPTGLGSWVLTSAVTAGGFSSCVAP